MAILLAILTGLLLYRHWTNPDRLRRYAEHWLAEFSGGEASVREVRFDLFHGLHLLGVTLATPEASHFDPADNSQAARTVFKCQSVFLRLRALGVITGHLVVPEIVAVDPELVLVRRMSDGVGNWNAMLNNRPPGRGGGDIRLPTIRMRNARVSQYRLDSRGRSGGSLQVVWADAQPVGQQPDVYDLQVSKLVESGEQAAGECANIRLNMRTLAVSGSLPTMTIDQLLFTAPPDVVRWMDVLKIRGLLRPESFEYDPDHPARIVLALRGGECAIPLTPEEEQQADGRFLAFSGIEGTLKLDGDVAQADLQGRFHRAPVTLQGQMRLAKGGSGVESMEMQLGARDVPLPRDDPAGTAAESRFVRRWVRLQNFVRDFDGIGPVDLVVHLRKPPGATGVEFVEGTMEARGVSARYLSFPYRLHELKGLVRFRADGTVGIESLVGTHGAGRVQVDGWDGGFKTQQGELVITGSNIILDDDLRSCLDPEDQALCRKFNVEAKMNLRVHLTRTDAPPGTRNNPWKSTIDVTFLDGSVQFEGFPYPLAGLGGSLRIARGGFEVSDVHARRGEAVVSVSGSAGWSGGADARLDLSLKAEKVPLDAAIEAALPDPIRREYAQLGPAGEVDLSARIRTTPERPEIGYEIAARLRRGAFTVPSTSWRVGGAEGEFKVTPGRLAMDRLAGVFGESKLRMSGVFEIDAREPAFDVHVSSEKLTLDSLLRDSLPDAIQQTWDSIEPSGHAKVDLTCRRGSVTTQPVTTRPVATRPGGVDYALRIEPLDCGMKYARFPLPLSGLSGSLLIKPARITIDRLQGRHAGGSFELGGVIRPLDERTEVEFAGNVRGLMLSEELRRAVPWRLRRLWNDVRPAGALDMDLERLAMSVRPNAPPTWECKGDVRLHDVGISSTLTELNGTLRGSARLAESFLMDAEVALDRARVDGRLATGLTAHAHAEDAAFRIADLAGGFYGGTVIGKIDLDYSRSSPEYGLSLTARDIQIADFINARLAPGEQPVKFKGRMEADLSLMGRVGEVSGRRGRGGVVIRDAQMLKVPLMLSILRVINFAIDDDNAFHNATFKYLVDGNNVLVDELDLRGRSLSMVGAGRVRLPNQDLDFTLLIGSPMKLPRFEVLSDLLEGVAREIMQVRVQGTLSKPTFHAEMVRSVRAAMEAIAGMRAKEPARR